MHKMGFGMFLGTVLLAGDILPLSFAEGNFEQYHNKEVEVRGFLYQDQQQHWVLAAEPNLRSCCIDSKPHITLPADFVGQATKQPVTLQGHFHVEPNHNYRMENVVFVTKPATSGYGLWLLVAVLGGVFLLKKWTKWTKKTSNKSSPSSSSNSSSPSNSSSSSN